MRVYLILRDMVKALRAKLLRRLQNARHETELNHLAVDMDIE